MDALQRQAQKQGCALVRFQAQSGASTADIYPIVEGEPITLDALSALVIEGKMTEKVRTKLMQQREQLLERLDEVNQRVRAEKIRVDGEVRAMDRQVAWKVLQQHANDFRRRWPQPEIANWLDMAGEFVERNLHRFVGVDVDDEEGKSVDAPVRVADGLRFAEFEAKIVKTSFNDACPVVIETNPTYGNLFGALAGADKIPYTDDGVNVLVGRLKKSLNKAVARGVLAEDPKPVVTYPKVADVDSADKTARHFPDLKFSGTLAGSINQVSIVGVVSA
jgi:hypothetical protein